MQKHGQTRLEAFQEFTHFCVDSEIRKLKNLLSDMESRVKVGDITNDAMKTAVAERLELFTLKVRNW